MRNWLKVMIIVISLLIGMAGLLLLLATLTEYRPVKPETAETAGIAPVKQKSESVFTLMTWNIGYFGLGKDCDFFFDGGKMTRPSKEQYRQYSTEAMEYLGQLKDVDFMFFQEVDINSRRSYHDDQVARFRQVFPNMESSVALNYVVSFVPVPIRNPMGKVKSGIVSFSAWHTIENTRYPFPDGYRWPVRLFQLERCFLLSRLALPNGKELVLFNTHNEAFDSGDQRKDQIAILRELMLTEYENGNYVITGGDWNMNPLAELPVVYNTGDIGRTIEPRFEPGFFPEEWKWAYDTEIPSNRNVDEPYTRGKTPTTIIDFFVVSPNISIESVKTQDIGFAWSDHQPVVMRFRIN
jgi:endonuclease/exonuclease/phosphatase family metal-dependent hydrolase